MARPRVAIIGGGIAGLTCAYRLQDDFDLTVFEANDRLGGHARTVVSPGGTPVNPNVVNFTRDLYPEFLALMKEIGFDDFRPAPISLVIHENGRILYADPPRDLKTFARNLPLYLDPRGAPSFLHWGRLVAFLYRLHRDYKAGRFPPDMPVADLAAYYPRHAEIVSYWAVPFALLKGQVTLTVQDLTRLLFTALSPRAVLDPSSNVTVRGAVRDYVELLARKTRADIRTASPVERLRKVAGGFELLVRGQAHHCDRVVVASQPRDVRHFIEYWRDDLRALFEGIDVCYDEMVVAVHADPSVFCGLPRRLWNSGCFNFDTRARRNIVSMYLPAFTSCREELFITYTDPHTLDLSAAPDAHAMGWHTMPKGVRLDPDKIIDARPFYHPLWGHSEQKARWRAMLEINGRDGLYFANVGVESRGQFGHESAVISALETAAALRRDAAVARPSA